MALAIRRHRPKPIALSDPYADQRDILQCFMNTLQHLLQALVKVWPECLASRKSKIKIDAVIGCKDIERMQTIIKDWRSTMHKFYKECEQRDIKMLDNDIPIFKELDLKTKITDVDLSEDSKKYFWQYIITLNRFAEAYHSVPSEILKRMEKVDITMDDMRDPKKMFATAANFLKTTNMKELSGILGNVKDLQAAGVVPNIDALMKQFGSMFQSILGNKASKKS